MSSRQLINAMIEENTLEVEKVFNSLMAEKMINSLNEVRTEYSRKMFRASVEENKSKKPQAEGPIAWEAQQQGPQ